MPVRRCVRGDLFVDAPRQRVLDQRLRERLHLEELALGDRIGDLVGPAFANEVGDARVHDHHLDGGDPASF